MHHLPTILGGRRHCPSRARRSPSGSLELGSGIDGGELGGGSEAAAVGPAALRSFGGGATARRGARVRDYSYHS